MKHHSKLVQSRHNNKTLRFFEFDDRKFITEAMIRVILFVVMAMPCLAMKESLDKVSSGLGSLAIANPSPIESMNAAGNLDSIGAQQGKGLHSASLLGSSSQIGTGLDQSLDEPSRLQKPYEAKVPSYIGNDPIMRDSITDYPTGFSTKSGSMQYPDQFDRDEFKAWNIGNDQEKYSSNVASSQLGSTNNINGLDILDRNEPLNSMNVEQQLLPRSSPYSTRSKLNKRFEAERALRSNERKERYRARAHGYPYSQMNSDTLEDDKFSAYQQGEDF